MMQNQVVKFTRAINLDDHDNKEIEQAILPHTSKQYKWTLVIFNKYLELHPPACYPPDTKLYKGFLEFYATNITGWIEQLPTQDTIKCFCRDFEAALAWLRGFHVLTSMFNTIEELWCRDSKGYRGKVPDHNKIQLTALILLYSRRFIARQKNGDNNNNANIRADTMAACYKKWEPPVHTFYKIYKEDFPLFFNFILLILPLFSANGAFCHYILSSEILDGLESIKVNILDTPVFWLIRELDVQSSTGKARNADVFRKEFAALVYWSGYRGNITAC
ncbi:hypothetical protein BDW62DRAFT_218817 [Aspergillus aurantiobrunneus]